MDSLINTATSSDRSPVGEWLKTHMTQFMVVINGLVLTLTAFFTLSVFVQQSLRDEYFNYNDVVRKALVNTFSGLELTLANYAHNPVQTADNSLFELVYIFPPSGGGDIRVLKGKAEDISLRFPVESLQTQNPDDTTLYSQGPLLSLRDDTMATVAVRHVAMLKKIKLPDGKIVHLAGFINAQKLSEKLALERNSLLSRTEISIKEKALPVYIMKNNMIAQTDVQDQSVHEQTMTLPVSHSSVLIKLTYLKQKQMALIEMVPWLLLAFGLTLTVIGWMYVRNNQEKSNMVTSANETLEQRNLELNQEINERERLNQTLRKSERENTAILNAVSDVIFEISLNGDILFLNEAWNRITGFPVEQMIGHNIFNLLHLHDQEEQRKNVSQLVKGQRQAYRAITRVRTSEGLFRSVEMAISMLRLDENKSLRIVGSFTDIDGRERAERALVEAERKYRTIWENAAGGIYQVTPEGQILSANPALANIFGYDLAEHMLRDIRNVHQQVFVQPHERLRLIKSMQKGDQPLSMENQAYTRDGGKIWVHEIIRPVYDDSDMLLYYEGSIENITTRKETENKLREAKLESDVANRAKSEFLANMSHELRTPLNSIIGFSEIIKNEVFGPVTPKPYWEYARDIHESGKHLLSIINQILDISRIDAGERELRDSIVDIRKVFQSCIEIVAPKAKSANLTLLEIGLDKAPNIIGEEVAIKQMIINLLSNALKFTPAGGRITLSVEHDTSGAVRLSVTDTGIGLDDAEIQKATSPFGVLDGSMNKSTSGIGLGLSLVQALMRLHGGRLEIFSQKGLGTTVTLVFPQSRVHPLG